MRRAIVSPLAERDIESIWVFIAERNFDAAARVCDEIAAEIRKLAENPGMGHRRVDVRDERYRFWKIFSYLIAYRVDDQELVGIRVVHGARDIPSLFNR